MNDSVYRMRFRPLNFQGGDLVRLIAAKDDFDLIAVKWEEFPEAPEYAQLGHVPRRGPTVVDMKFDGPEWLVVTIGDRVVFNPALMRQGKIWLDDDGRLHERE